MVLPFLLRLSRASAFGRKEGTQSNCRLNDPTHTENVILIGALLPSLGLIIMLAPFLSQQTKEEQD